MGGWRCRVALAAAGLVAAAPAWGGEREAQLNLTVPALPQPADSGKPMLPRSPLLAPREAQDCVQSPGCGARLLGTVRKNGAVEVQVPAWRW